MKQKSDVNGFESATVDARNAASLLGVATF